MAEIDEDRVRAAYGAAKYERLARIKADVRPGERLPPQREHQAASRNGLKRRLDPSSIPAIGRVSATLDGAARRHVIALSSLQNSGGTRGKMRNRRVVLARGRPMSRTGRTSGRRGRRSRAGTRAGAGAQPLHLDRAGDPARGSTASTPTCRRSGSASRSRARPSAGWSGPTTPIGGGRRPLRVQQLGGLHVFSDETLLLEHLEPEEGVPLSYYVGPLGGSGSAAYVGLHDVGQHPGRRDRGRERRRGRRRQCRRPDRAHPRLPRRRPGRLRREGRRGPGPAAVRRRDQLPRDPRPRRGGRARPARTVSTSSSTTSAARRSTRCC